MTNQSNNPPNDDVFDIPVRINEQIDQTDEMINRLKQEEREAARIVEEYENRYYGQQGAGSNIYYEDEPEKEKRDSWWGKFANMADDYQLPPRHRYPSRAVQSAVSDNERTWAALAHANAILTLIFAMAGGPAVVLPLLVPLAIYFYYRRRSEYVAFHSLQAFTMQVVGTIGFLIVLLSGITILTMLIVVSALFSVVLVGIPFLLLFILMLVLFVPATLIMPLAMVVYGAIAAYAANKGRNYRYPYVADWVDDQLSNGIFGVAL